MSLSKKKKKGVGVFCVWAFFCVIRVVLLYFLLAFFWGVFRLGFLGFACYIPGTTGAPLPVIYIFFFFFAVFGECAYAYLCVSECLLCWDRVTKKEQRRREREKTIGDLMRVDLFLCLCAFNSDHRRRRHHHQRITARRWRGEKKRSAEYGGHIIQRH